MRARLRAGSAVIAIGVALAGCSADAVEEPLPTFETPGAFVASREANAERYRLFRTRTLLALDADRTYLFFDEHLDGAANVAEAKRKARDPALSLTFVGPRLLSNFAQTDWHVVWYRSMSEEERGAHGGL